MDPIKATLCIDDAVGETRQALLDPFGRPFRLSVERWSERRGRARLGEVWWGRATAKAPGASGWFVDLGLQQPGYLETKKGGIVEGELLPTRIKAEAWAEKGPLLSLADMKADAPRPQEPQRHAAPPDDPFLRGVEMIATIREEAARRQVDAAIEAALERTAPVPGGGEITIEPTRALTAIDVDAGGRTAAAADALARDLNLAAAEEAARQIGLRGIGGLVVIDFVSMTQKRDRRAVAEALRQSLQVALGRASQVLEISELGVCEAAIARRQRPLADALAGDASERQALEAIRLLESEGRKAPGARLQARVSTGAAAWLAADTIGWSKALADRIGMRWTIEAADRMTRPEVWSQK